MNIQSVNDKAFEVYGRVVDGYDYAELLATLEKCSEKPTASAHTGRRNTQYVTS